jgi:drug/metabolite transporter (DMT)-like permease
MFPAFLTTLLWSVSAVSAQRAARLISGAAANLIRLTAGALLLAAWAHAFGGGLHGPGLWWFVASGFVGFGIADAGLYEALPRIGSRLTMLIMQCLAAPLAAVLEWLWLGTTLSVGQIAAGLAILVGVALALAPQEHLHRPRRDLIVGVLLSLIAAAGQGCGAVLSRKAYQLTGAAGLTIDGGTAAYQRIIGGLGVAVVFFLWMRSRREGTAHPSIANWRAAVPWSMLNTLGGPVIGVTCFQWALSTTPSGIVLPIVALIPLVVMPKLPLTSYDGLLLAISVHTVVLVSWSLAWRICQALEPPPIHVMSALVVFDVVMLTIASRESALVGTRSAS